MINEISCGKWIINGDGGTGKTHLFFELISFLEKKNINSENILLILGNPTTQLEAENKFPKIKFYNMFSFCGKLSRDYSLEGINKILVEEIVNLVSRNINKEIILSLRRKYKYIIVDNYECLSIEGANILKSINCENSVFFGDLNGSLTGLENSDLCEDYNTITLSKNFRCSKDIISVAKKIIKNTINLSDSEILDNINVVKHVNNITQFHWMVKTLKELSNKGSTAILCRTNKDVFSVAETLKFFNINFDLLKNGINQEVLKNVLSIFNSIFFIEPGQKNFNFVKDEDIQNCLKIFKIQTRIRNKIIEEVKKGSGIEIHLSKYTEIFEKINKIKDEDSLKKKIELIMNLFLEKKDYRILDLISSNNIKDELDVLYRLKTLGLKEKSNILLGTIHQGRSLEVDNLIIPFLSEGNFPHYESIFKGHMHYERQLFYIALTRAKNLFLSYFLERVNKFFGPSRFLQAIPEKNWKYNS